MRFLLRGRWRCVGCKTLFRVAFAPGVLSSVPLERPKKPCPKCGGTILPFDAQSRVTETEGGRHAVVGRRMKKSVDERIRDARERLKACPRDAAAERELAAAIIARRVEYNELRDLCARINSLGGDA